MCNYLCYLDVFAHLIYFCLNLLNWRYSFFNQKNFKKFTGTNVSEMVFIRSSISLLVFLPNALNIELLSVKNTDVPLYILLWLCCDSLCSLLVILIFKGISAFFCFDMGILYEHLYVLIGKVIFLTVLAVFLTS